VATAADLSAAAREARQKGRTEMLVLVDHGGQKLFVPLQLGKAMG
jgi:hypothetical protein